ncbi:MAG: HEAT repeat domain-containing protein [Bacteroidales bacterium]|nr:HEAT repeat domain-containing protein [Bacteroidales bacterium]
MPDTISEKVVILEIPDIRHDSIPENEIEEDSWESAIKRYTSYVFEHFKKSPLLITILYIVIIYSILTLIVLLIFILIHRSKIEREDKMKEKLSENYQQLLMDYLFDPDRMEPVTSELVSIASNKFKRQILINQMIDLSVNLKGEIKSKIKELYLNLGLKKDSMEKAKSRKWHENIKGFRELAFMNIRDANKKIVESLDSRNEILRMEAQIALVRLSDDNPYQFLDLMKKPFSLWEQITLHELVVQHNLIVPDFSRLFDSGNTSIVMFALQMTAWFKQRESEEKIFKLLGHEDEAVRNTAIRVCGTLGLKNSLSHLQHIYDGETYKNRLEILRTFAKVPDETYLDFLKSVLDREEDVQLQINATKAMENTDEPGISMLIKLMKSKSEYKNYQIIIRHVLDGRIY